MKISIDFMEREGNIGCHLEVGVAVFSLCESVEKKRLLTF
jgi:hypothetical protein